MTKIQPKTLSLNIDGKTVELHHDAAQAFELNKALTDDAEFKAFAADPKSFAAKYHLNIDKAVADQLKSKLSGVACASALQQTSGGGVQATVWAVAGGAYSFATSKIAVAF